MTQFHVLARRLVPAASVACVFAAALLAAPTAGEAAKAKASKPQPAGPSAQGPGAGNDGTEKAAAAEAAKKAYDGGLKDYAAGRYPSSIAQLSTAVKSGALTSSEMAKALMTRGLAYKKDNKPGQSISDLTGAIWLKNGLSPNDQKSAIAERAEAYRMAGLQDTGSMPDQRAIGTPTTPTASADATPAAANSASGPNAGSAGLSAAAIAEAAGAQKASSAQGTSATNGNPAVNGETTLQSAAAVGVAGESSKPASSGIGGFFGWGQSAQAPEPAAAPTPSTGSSLTQSVTAIPGNVSGFFSNMFSSGSSAPAPDASQPVGVTTASTTVTVSVPETSSWSSGTSIALRTKPEVVKAEKASYAPEAGPKTAALTKGKFKIHIAAVRSKAEAEALAQKLIAQHGPELGKHVPVVDQAVIGSMGTFYRVRIGGYASQDEPRSLCNQLRTSGLDCLVVTN